MASVWTRVYDAEVKCERCQQLTTTQLDRPKPPRNRLPPAPAVPIWQSEIKNAHFASSHRSLRCVVPHAYYFEPSQTPPLITPSPPRTPSRPLHDALERTLVFHRLSINQRPFRRFGPPLRTKADQRPYTSQNSYTTVRPLFKPVRIQRAMTSSLVDQIPLPGATGEPPEVGIGRPSSLSPKRSSDVSRTSLITNSFLHPTSAKVPLSPQKNLAPPHAGAKSSSWHSGEKVDFGWPNGGVTALNHNSIGTENTLHKAASSGVQGTAKAEGAACPVNGNVANIPYRGIQLTEAVRRLAGRQLDLSPQPVCQRDQAFASCFENSPSTVQSEPLNCMASCSWTSNGLCLNGDHGNPSNNHVCHDQSGFSDSCDLGTSCQNTDNSDIAIKPPVNGESAQPTNITIMASQISTIHLNRTGVNKASDRPDSAASDSELPVPSCEQDCVEEELPEGLDDSQEEEDDDEDPDDPSITRVSSAASLSDSSRRCGDNVDPTTSVMKPALTPSLFPNMPLTLYFGTQDEKVALLPWAQRKLLKWKMSTVTPNVVKQAVARSHFRVTKKHDWLGCWGHHMKSVAFKTIREYQKLNHFPGSFQIGRKDRLWRNLSKMQARFGRKEFNFFPQSFVLPQDIKLLKKAWEQGGTKQKWIVKPPASARGMGIQVIHRWSQLPKKRPLLVQRYLHKPYLISGSKFDLRIYVYVTSYDPLRVYLFTDGLVRFASCKYSSSMKSLSNKFMHLTNYSVNKKNVDYMANTDETACQGHKWALRALWTYLDQKGFSSEKIWEKIKEMVIKTIIASEPYVNSLVKMCVQNPYSCHELFGFDIMLDENLKPWVLEVNISPSLHSNSPLDVSIKGQMIRDLLNLAGFLLPNKEDMISSNATSSSSAASNGKERGRPLEILNEEKAKRARYLVQKLPDKDLYATVLDQLTLEDVRVLMETEDELSRCGQFERVFPSAISSRYLRFFEQQRYFNILTNQWEQKYYNDRESGRELLRSLCTITYHDGSLHPPRSPVKCPAQSTAHLNGFIKGDVPSPSKLAASPEEKLRSFKLSSLQQQQEEKMLLSQSLSNVSEPTLVM
ncbi:tubulin monoglutamylase TTLL4 [Gastrophryne carolinensis]